MTTFSDVGMSQKFIDVLDEIGYTSPTPIQEQAIPLILGGNDVFGCAQTGTGKTGAFSLPMLQLLDATHDDSTSTKGKRVYIRSLILTPTRELAIQIAENLREYSKKTNLRNTVIYGGVKQKKQVARLSAGVEILVATPGRLLDLINQKHINLSKVEVFILDEADRMLDMGFIHDMKKVAKLLPKKRQTLFFSATTTEKVKTLAGDFLQNPKHISVTPESSTVDTVSQSLYTLRKEDKKALLLHLLQTPDITNAVVFSRTKHGANKIEKILMKAGISAAAIHGNKSQNARQKALTALKSGTIRVLVATDVAARGIDVNLLSHVIIYDVPVEPEVYVHRIGRTGRAGKTGEAIMFCDASEVKHLRDIISLIGKDVPHTTDHPFHQTLDMNATPPKKKQGGGRNRNQRSGGKASSRPSSRGTRTRAGSRQSGGARNNENKGGENKRRSSRR